MNEYSPPLSFGLLGEPGEQEVEGTILNLTVIRRKILLEITFIFNQTKRRKLECFGDLEILCYLWSLRTKIIFL